ncbi:hypothetical protein CR513_59778, partial [Mucuna pruriens]
MVRGGRIFKFLHGLNFEYDPIRSEEIRRLVMLDKGNSNTGSAMVIGKDPTKRSTSEEKSFTKSSRREYCTYCKRSGHTEDTCYKHYGKEKFHKAFGPLILGNLQRGGRLELLNSKFNKSIKRLRSNNGTKFVNLEFSKFLKDNGVVHELTCVNTPQQNRVVERKNRHLLEVARALLFQMSIPNVYWGEVVLTVAYLINKLPIRVLN